MPLISLSLKKKELIDLRLVSVDSTFKAKFLDSSIAPFFIYARSEYPAIASKALSILLPFSTSFLCEAAFSTMKIIKMEHISCAQVYQQFGHESKSYVLHFVFIKMDLGEKRCVDVSWIQPAQVGLQRTRW
jgi:hypothetical protein